MQTPTIELSEFQNRAMEVPEACDLFLGGGRGGGKSYLMALMIVRHVEQYGERGRVLFVRKSYRGIADFELVCREVFGKIYGTGARYNAGEHVWRFPNGAYLELGQIETFADYDKYQGRSFTMLMADEAGQYADPALLDMLRSNLRGPKDMPIRCVVAANPGGVGHHWLSQRYVFRAEPWAPFYEDKSERTWVYAPSTFAGNTFIDQREYTKQLRAACPEDPELLRAWVEGDWTVNRGAYFAGCMDEKRNAVENWDEIPEGWQTYIAHDFGSAAPSATYVFAISPGEEVAGRFYPRNSAVLVDELATNKKGNLNAGLGWTVPDLAGQIKAMCARWKIPPRGVADDACFAKSGHSTGSIADEFREFGVFFEPARKADRITGWNRMRKLLSQAGLPDRPGLYIARRCRYFWETVPTLARDDRKIEDLDSDGPDHGADAVRYGVLRMDRRISVEPLRV